MRSFFGGARKCSSAKESAFEKGEKRTPDTITVRVVCRPLFAYAILSSLRGRRTKGREGKLNASAKRDRPDLILCHAFN